MELYPVGFFGYLVCCLFIHKNGVRFKKKREKQQKLISILGLQDGVPYISWYTAAKLSLIPFTIKFDKLLLIISNSDQI